MRIVRSALAAYCLISFLPLSAATRIDDPKAFVSEVYRRFTPDSSHSTYTPPEDIYTPALKKLFSTDKRKAKGEVGCVDFIFWLNAQDWKITDLTITSTADGPDKQTVTTKFRNFGESRELHFDFRRVSGHWLLEDAHSVLGEPWTLSELLKCSH